MAREAAKTTRHGGLYDWLVDREERAAAAGGVLANENGTSYSSHRHRLAAVRAGQPVSMCVGDLPAHTRVGLDTRWMHRATVSPDGGIEVYVDSGGEWLAENGL